MEMILCLIAYCTKSALVFSCKSFITLYLCAATVRGVIFSAEATSFMERPSANS